MCRPSPQIPDKNTSFFFCPWPSRLRLLKPTTTPAPRRHRLPRSTPTPTWSRWRRHLDGKNEKNKTEPRQPPNKQDPSLGSGCLVVVGALFCFSRSSHRGGTSGLVVLPRLGRLHRSAEVWLSRQAPHLVAIRPSSATRSSTSAARNAT